jgi:hypothetical protein
MLRQGRYFVAAHSEGCPREGDSIDTARETAGKSLGQSSGRLKFNSLHKVMAKTALVLRGVAELVGAMDATAKLKAEKERQKWVADPARPAQTRPPGDSSLTRRHWLVHLQPL